MMMGLQRVFLGWDRPILWSALDWLAAHFRQGDRWDLSQLIIVLPSSLAGRRLLEYLVIQADEAKWYLLPPKICTMGSLPELLYRARRPLAGDAVQAMVWTEVLLKAPSAALEDWLFQVPDKSRIDEWLDLAKTISTMHRELASDDLDFATVAQLISDQQIAPLNEQKRWAALALLQREYWNRLDRLDLWDAQTARRIALQKKELNCPWQIVSIGNVDLNLIQKRFLQEIETTVTTLIGAPEKWKGGFDAAGCLVAEAWQTLDIPIENSQLLVAGNPADQSQVVTQLLQEMLERFDSKEITVGVPDATLIPYLQFQFEQTGLTVRYGPGVSLAESPPFKLMAALTTFLQGPTYANWASLLRQPAIESFLRRKLQLPADWLISIDRYYHETLAREVPSPQSPQPEKRYAAARSIAVEAAELLDELLQPLRGSSRPIWQWVDPVLHFLQELLADFEVSEEEPLAHLWLEGCRLLNELICSITAIPPDVQLPLSCAETLRWLMRQASGNQIPEPQDPQAIEMLGWLELMLDDTPALVMTGMALSVVPDAVHGDAFLPNQLRSSLGLMDNERRWARDAYSFMVATQAREELKVVVGRLGAGGEPQLPSRLLFATNVEQIGPRTSHLLKPQPRSTSQKPSKRWQPLDEDQLLPIPEFVKPFVPTALSVTDFKSYLTCPYRFYLDRVLRLEPLDDSSIELDARRFGTLVHDCLDKLVDPTMCSCRDADRIFEFLKSELDKLVRVRFGNNKSAALEIQVAQAEQRLRVFSIEQAKRAEAGWVIKYTELKIEEGDAYFPVEGAEPMKLKGRIDRIDYNAESNTMAIWDYKTSDTFNEPKAAHLDARSGEWYDLQLPLYRHMIAKFREGDFLQVGYITLPRKLADIKFRVADFSETELAAADVRAAEIITQIRAGIFGPPVFPPPYPIDPYAAICQNDILRRGPIVPFSG
jgi:hypothetical protein